MEQSKESARDWIEKNHPDKIELYEAIKETFDRFYICFTEAICEDGILFTYPLVLGDFSFGDSQPSKDEETAIKLSEALLELSLDLYPSYPTQSGSCFWKLSR